MGTYVQFYCPLKHQRILPGDINGLSNKSHHVSERSDLGRLLVHLLSGYGEGPHWYMVCLTHDSTPRHPDGGLPDHDTVCTFEDVTELAVQSYNEAWPEAEPLVYDPALARTERLHSEGGKRPAPPLSRAIELLETAAHDCQQTRVANAISRALSVLYRLRGAAP